MADVSTQPDLTAATPPWRTPRAAACSRPPPTTATGPPARRRTATRQRLPRPKPPAVAACGPSVRLNSRETAEWSAGTGAGTAEWCTPSTTPGPSSWSRRGSPPNTWSPPGADRRGRGRCAVQPAGATTDPRRRGRRRSRTSTSCRRTSAASARTTWPAGQTSRRGRPRSRTGGAARSSSPGFSATGHAAASPGIAFKLVCGEPLGLGVLRHSTNESRREAVPFFALTSTVTCTPYRRCRSGTASRLLCGPTGATSNRQPALPLGTSKPGLRADLHKKSSCTGCAGANTSW